MRHFILLSIFSILLLSITACGTSEDPLATPTEETTSTTDETTSTTDETTSTTDETTSTTDETTSTTQNSAPVITSSDSISVDENQLSLFRVIATDENNDTLIFSLSGTDSDKITIDRELGVLTFKIAPDYEIQNIYAITVSVTDAIETTSQDIFITINNLNDEAINICNTSSLFFDSLPQNGELNPWISGEDNLLNNTKLHWNTILGAASYKFEIVFPGGWTPPDISTYSATNIRFDYDSTVSGYETSILNNDMIITSDAFTQDAVVTITLKAVDSSNNVIKSASPLSFKIARTYIDTASSSVVTSPKDTAINLEWCTVTGATAYTIKYGSSTDNLLQTMSDLPLDVLLKEVQDLSNETSYYFSLAAQNINGLGKFTEIIKATPTLDKSTTDFSVEYVTFNQSVQVDLLNNTNLTPIISNKPGVLRVFINANDLTQNQKVDIELGGSYNGVTLPSIIKEVALSDSTFTSSDSSNQVVFFDINTSEWLQVGTSFYINIDPYNKIIEIDETNNRYPSANEQSFGFEDRYKMRVKLIPVLTASGAVTLTSEIATGLSNYMKALYPLSDVEVTIGEQLDESSLLLTDNTSEWSTMIDDITLLKNNEVTLDSTKADIFYYGVFDKDGSSASGLMGLASLNSISSIQDGFEPNLVGVGRIDSISLESFYETTAHEIGHNHGREHVDNSKETNDLCAIPSGTDSNFPYNITGEEYGRIGKTGYRDTTHTLLEKNYYHDMMSYCSRTWISDYTYKAIYEFEKELDIFYDRANNINARVSSRLPSTTSGLMIAGEFSKESNSTPLFTLTKKYPITWKSTIVEATTDFYASITFSDESQLKIPFLIMKLDHSDREHFQFFIPSTKEISSIVITSTVSEKSYTLSI